MKTGFSYNYTFLLHVPNPLKLSYKSESSEIDLIKQIFISQKNCMFQVFTLKYKF